MLLGNNMFDWLMCPLHVNVISALQSAVPWCLTNLSSVGTGDQGLEGRGRIHLPRAGNSNRHSKGTELCLLALAMKSSSSALFPTWSLLTPPDPSRLDRLVEERAGQRDGKPCLTSACCFVPVCSSPQWDYVEPKYREALLRNKDDGEFWYFPIDHFVYCVFCSCSLWKKKSHLGSSLLLVMAQGTLC